MYTGIYNSTTTLFRGISRSTRQRSIDAYAAMVCNNIYYIFCSFAFVIPLSAQGALIFCCMHTHGEVSAILSLNPFCLFWLQMVLERYFSMAGHGTELVLPKNLDLQEKLKTGPAKDVDFFPEEFEG